MQALKANKMGVLTTLLLHGVMGMFADEGWKVKVVEVKNDRLGKNQAHTSCVLLLPSKWSPFHIMQPPVLPIACQHKPRVWIYVFAKCLILMESGFWIPCPRLCAIIKVHQWTSPHKQSHWCSILALKKGLFFFCLAHCASLSSWIKPHFRLLALLSVHSFKDSIQKIQQCPVQSPKLPAPQPLCT